MKQNVKLNNKLFTILQIRINIQKAERVPLGQNGERDPLGMFIDQEGGFDKSLNLIAVLDVLNIIKIFTSSTTLFEPIIILLIFF